MSKKAAKKVTQEIETIEIPSELQQRSKLGIQQAKREMRKTTRTKRFLKNIAVVAAGIVLAVALGAATSPTFASFVKSLVSAVDAIKEVDFEEVDQKYVDAAKKAIEQHSNGKAFKLDKVQKHDNHYVFETKMSEDFLRSDVSVYVDAKTGEVFHINLRFKADEVTGSYKEYVESAQSAVKQINSKSTFQVNEMQYNWFKGGIEQFRFYGDDKDNKYQQYIELEAETNKVLGYRINFKPADVDEAIISAAEKAVKSIPNTTLEPFTRAIKVKFNESEEERWVVGKITEHTNNYGSTYVNEKESTFATIGEKSGKVYEVNVPRETQYEENQLTNEQIVAIAKPVVQEVLGVDLSNYEPKSDSQWGGYQFSSPGKETIRIGIHNNGHLHSIELAGQSNWR
ncbi:DUF4179 domain-containing protein [Bacillus chungangensis]|uniref:DUF4179 domain-containing protein n=1 Tax=Bacillus chungangensis TaxID=587633 RepID=A0ABT9WQ44_9BACI|nr:DUF4179 domain-containing protein [Bacillus chungangensis]MDQ0175325.1 hypothetical protein [Bacillus chungangensis]